MQLTHQSGRVEKTDGAERPKGRTRRLLLEHASILLGQGQIASVAEVAQHAGVSRATAYRYFPTRGKMISAVVDFSLGPVRQAASSIADGRERIEELFRQTFPRFMEFEPQLRAALQVSLTDMALERAGRLTEEPYRRGHRIDILSHAATTGWYGLCRWSTASRPISSCATSGALETGKSRPLPAGSPMRSSMRRCAMRIATKSRLGAPSATGRTALRRSAPSGGETSRHGAATMRVLNSARSPFFTGRCKNTIHDRPRI